MFCGNCGNQLSEQAKFCNKCGTPVTSDEHTEEATVEPAPLAENTNTQAAPTAEPIKTEPAPEQYFNFPVFGGETNASGESADADIYSYSDPNEGFSDNNVVGSGSAVNDFNNFGGGFTPTQPSNDYGMGNSANADSDQSPTQTSFDLFPTQPAPTAGQKEKSGNTVFIVLISVCAIIFVLSILLIVFKDDVSDIFSDLFDKEDTSVSDVADNDDNEEADENNYYKPYVEPDTSSTAPETTTSPETTTLPPSTEPSTQAPTAALSAYYTVTTKHSNLNLRKLPDQNSDVLAHIPKGAIIVVTAIQGNWAQTSYKGHTGWASLDFLTPVQ